MSLEFLIGYYHVSYKKFGKSELFPVKLLDKYIKSDILLLMIDRKPIEWIGSSKDDLCDFPKDVRYDLGHALQEAQDGGKHVNAKPLKGHKGGGVLEIVDRHDSDTYRAIYTIRFKKAVYVLHCFQKKSKAGIKTAQQDIELINRRLKIAAEDYVLKYGKD